MKRSMPSAARGLRVCVLTPFGARVHASYVDHADWTELRFVVEEPAS